MRKNELIHLHALLRTVADYLVASGDLDPDVLATYEACGVTPMSLQAARPDHKAAVLLLGEALATGLRDATDADAVGDAESVGDSMTDSEAGSDAASATDSALDTGGAPNSATR